MNTDPTERADTSEVQAEPTPPEEPQTEQADVATDDASEPAPRQQRILIGSQRDPDAYLPKPRHDWAPLKEDRKDSDQAAKGHGEERTPIDEQAAEASASHPPDVQAAKPEPKQPLPPGSFPPPNIRDRLPPALEEDLQEAMGDASLDELMAGSETVSSQPQLEAESRHTGRVIAVQRDDVFVELGGREQGIVPLKQFAELAEPPEPGTALDVIVARFNREEGLYELMLPHASANIGDWADLAEGMTVEARVTGHNTGGLECEVNRIPGFIPVSQISLYRVEDLAEFVDQKFICLVTEANPERRNLVLSHRAVLEREREQARQELLDSLKPGQIREGVVRKLMDFGAFVDLGGVDGLLHVSQLGWGRVNHPSDVLTEGQTIKGKVEKVNRENNRISLGYRDMLENPWTNVESKYPVNSVVNGTVSKLMEFGAFVQLEPGVEGLVHISELSHKRVMRTSDVVSEGDEIEAVVLSVDAEAQRIGLSMKDALPAPKPTKDEDDSAREPDPPAKRPKKSTKPLMGGLGRPTGGDEFGLKW